MAKQKPKASRTGRTASSAKSTTGQIPPGGPSLRGRLDQQTDQLYDAMAMIYVAAGIMDDKQDTEGNYLWRVLQAAHKRCEGVALALDEIAAGVAHG